LERIPTLRRKGLQLSVNGDANCHAEDLKYVAAKKPVMTKNYFSVRNGMGLAFWDLY
jgi:hypothetical protein